MKSVNIIHGWTKDDLNLQGFHWDSAKKETCVVCIHGMSGNIIENYFAEVLGEELSKNNYGFLFGHNRGYGHINEIKTSELQEDGGKKTKQIGATYERFEESAFDVDLWVNKAKELGYEKIVLMGHSLGCNKIIHYLSLENNPNVSGAILASPPDMVGLAKLEKYQPNYSEMLAEAKENVANNKPRKILNSVLWDWCHISSQTFLDLCEDGCPADNLPLLRNPGIFDEFLKIEIPTLALMGENDDIAIKTLEEDLELIRSKATNCQSFETAILKGANHMYDNKEVELSHLLLSWLDKNNY